MNIQGKKTKRKGIERKLQMKYYLTLMAIVNIRITRVKVQFYDQNLREAWLLRTILSTLNQLIR